MAKISFYGVDGEERSYALHPQLRLRIGRDPGNDVVLRDPKVSRRHAEIAFERGFFVLHDLQSANGTYLNGHRVKTAPLTNGAELKLGNSHGRFADEADEVPKGTVMGSERPDRPAPRPSSGTAEMPPEEWQTHSHPKRAPADHTSSPPQSALNPKEEELGETSLIEEEGDDESDSENLDAVESAFSGLLFEIDRGIPWGEFTTVRGDDGSARLFYRRTFNIVGFVAAAVSILVLLAGLVVSMLLAVDGRPLLAGLATGITIVFTTSILLLVPRRHLLVFTDPEAGLLAMRIMEMTLPGLPNPAFRIHASDGSTIGYLRKHTLSSFPARRWSVLGPKEEPLAKAKEDGLIKPFFRKFMGDLFGSLTTDYTLVANGSPVCRLIRRETVRFVHTLAIEQAAPRIPDPRMLLAFAFAVDLVEKSR